MPRPASGRTIRDPEGLTIREQTSEACGPKGREVEALAIGTQKGGIGAGETRGKRHDLGRLPDIILAPHPENLIGAFGVHPAPVDRVPIGGEDRRSVESLPQEARCEQPRHIARLRLPQIGTEELWEGGGRGETVARQQSEDRNHRNDNHSHAPEKRRLHRGSSFIMLGG